MKSKIKLSVIPLQAKLSAIFIMAALLVFIVNVMLMIGINNMSDEMDAVYKDNLKLNELSTSLDLVQSNLTDYLNTKTTDSLEQYYMSAGNYSRLVSELNSDITDDNFELMERNIRTMSEEYLEITENAIEAKRGRNVEKYSAEYDKAERTSKYINTYINSLNNEKFKDNSASFSRLISDFKGALRKKPCLDLRI